MARIWILDQKTELRTLLEYLARQMGHEVFSFPFLKEARHALRDVMLGKGEMPDLIISDRCLKDGMSDAWLCYVKRKFSEIRVVCFSSELDDLIIKKFQKQGIICLNKLATLGDILEVFRSLDSRGWQGSEIRLEFEAPYDLAL